MAIASDAKGARMASRRSPQQQDYQASISARACAQPLAEESCSRNKLLDGLEEHHT